MQFGCAFKLGNITDRNLEHLFSAILDKGDKALEPNKTMKGRRKSTLFALPPHNIRSKLLLKNGNLKFIKRNLQPKLNQMTFLYPCLDAA